MDPYLTSIGIGLAVGVAGLGVGIGQGLAANGGLNGMSRQPESAKQINNSMLLALVFLELVFLLSFVMGFMLQGKIPSELPKEKTSYRMDAPQRLASGGDKLPESGNRS